MEYHLKKTHWQRVDLNVAGYQSTAMLSTRPSYLP